MHGCCLCHFGLLSLTPFVHLAYGLQMDGCQKWALLITLEALLFMYLLGWLVSLQLTE